MIIYGFNFLCLVKHGENRIFLNVPLFRFYLFIYLIIFLLISRACKHTGLGESHDEAEHRGHEQRRGRVKRPRDARNGPQQDRDRPLARILREHIPATRLRHREVRKLGR